MESTPSVTQQDHGIPPTISGKRIATTKIDPTAVKTHNVADFNFAQIKFSY